MGTGYDCMDELASGDNKNINAVAYKNRQLLRAVMEKYGFNPYPKEWWHFTLNNEPYPATYFNFPVKRKISDMSLTLQASQQLLLVTTSDWNAMKGMLQRYQRSSLKEKWRAVGKPVPVVIGEHGMAWGVNSASQYSKQLYKKEGDLRTPAGVFAIGSAFGFAPDPVIKSKIPYLAIKDSVVCVDDVNSRYYNQVIDKAGVAHPDWNSSEAMRQIPPYELGAIISYNSEKPVSGAGSCIFMHIWRNADTGTSGCVAMSEEDLKQVLAWLNHGKKPVIALFTKEEYQRYINNIRT
jgi:D-alanyl-D-alanine dipeptidase